MKTEGLKKDTAVWVRGYVDGLGSIDFLDGERSGMLDCLCEEDILYMSDSDFRLDEPMQPKLEVTQFLADWYEEHKDNFYLNLHRLAWELIENLDEDDFVPKKALDSDFKQWYHKTETAIQTLINMHQFGYTVEKEKLYNVSVLGCTLFKMTSNDLVKYKLIGENETLSEQVLSLYKFEANLTEKEIKQADERLWQLAESAF